MSALKDATRMAGYSQEELYFHNLNQELIGKLREKAKSPPKKRGHLTLVHSVDDSSTDTPAMEATDNAADLKKAA